jgi:hypothetical protein
MTHGRKPPPLMPEVLPLVSPRPKAPYAMGLRPSVLTYDPVCAGRLLPKESALCIRVAGAYQSHSKRFQRAAASLVQSPWRLAIGPLHSPAEYLSSGPPSAPNPSRPKTPRSSRVRLSPVRSLFHLEWRLPLNSSAILVLVYLASSAGEALAQSAPALIFDHANVIDGVSVRPLLDATVVTRDAKVASIGHAVADPGLPAQHINLGGRWMLPGLIDAHVHPFSLQGAQNMLRAGVTTARSMLTIHYIDVGLRELHRRGAVDIPEILAAGYPIVPSPSQFKPDISGMFLDVSDLLTSVRLPISGSMACGAWYARISSITWT